MTASLSDQLAGLVGPGQMLPPESLPGYAIGGLIPEAVAQPVTTRQPKSMPHGHIDKVGRKNVVRSAFGNSILSA